VLRLMRLKGQPRMTPNTIVSPTALLAELRKIRQQGFAISNQENELEARCIGAPILDSEGRVLAALGVSSPAFRMEIPRALTFLPRLKEACAKISSDVRI
jgi:DNA-binding IclR family transcriptional regulator